MSSSESPKTKNPHAVAIGELGGHGKFKKYGSETMRAMAILKWKKWRAAKDKVKI